MKALEGRNCKDAMSAKISAEKVFAIEYDESLKYKVIIDSYLSLFEQNLDYEQFCPL